MRIKAQDEWAYDPQALEGALMNACVYGTFVREKAYKELVLSQCVTATWAVRVQVGRATQGRDNKTTEARLLAGGWLEQRSQNHEVMQSTDPEVLSQVCVEVIASYVVVSEIGLLAIGPFYLPELEKEEKLIANLKNTTE